MNQQDIDELTEVFVEESLEIVENLNGKKLSGRKAKFEVAAQKRRR